MSYQIIPLVAIIVTIGLPIAAWITAIVFRHQERMEMLRRGIVPPLLDRHAYRAWRRAGSPWPPPGTPVGAPQGSGPWVQQQPPWTPAVEDDPQRALFKGIRVALIGFAITVGIGVVFGGYSGNPIILGGLIPMFVGIAQIIIALLSGAQLPGMQPRVTFMPPPPQAPPGPGMPPPAGYGAATPPPWGQQPGRARFEELSKPAPPPDAR
jgi:hypothetical protein